ncbi:MAG: ThiF family adenylyltransferase [Halarchaeum sp.]
MTGLDLDPTELDRYSRHIIMDGVGPEGQAALRDANVLVVGAGGLGAPAIEYLAAAGVGRLAVVDDDVVERSNLQRQVIHRDADVGTSKVDSARRFVADLNPDVDVETHDERLSPENAESLVTGRDFVVDCTDNFETRYLVNDACVINDVPFSHGAVYRFEGQAITVTPDGPCYRCVFPEPPEPGVVPDCATAGVLGVLPGTVGCLQATEAVKSVVGVGDLLTGRLLHYDAASVGFDEVPVARDPDCPACGDDPIDSVADVAYADGCTVA